MHRAERLFLAVMVPLTMAAAVADLLGRWHAWAVWLGTLPVCWLALNVLPFLFRASRPRTQWLAWAGLLGAWAAWRRRDGGVANVFAWAWLAVLAVESLAAMVLLWRRAMRWSGKRGIAWRWFLLVAPHAAAVALGLRFGLAWGLIAGAVVATGLCAGILRPASRLLGPMLTRHDGDGVWLTIDDGPDPQDTPRLLDALDNHGVKAVFFVIGEKAAAHPELVREIVRRGHELGNHTLSHPQATFWCAGPARTRREIEGCQRVLTEITGIKPRWFRAPVGHRNLFTHPIAAELGLEVMAWSCRGYDAVCKDADKAVARILTDVRDGGIVLMHEATPIALRVLDGVLDGLRQRGFKPSAPTRSDDC